VATLIPACLGFAQNQPVVRPILDPASVPPWFETGRFRCARWDGGPIEADKGVLSHWINYTEDDPRQVLQATRDWYNPKTIDLLKMAHINWAWVTWSNGFSPSTEKKQWELVAPYIKLCHQKHIHVTAYISIGNMFWKDMFEHVPGSLGWVLRDTQGAPVFYSRPNRYMADIRNAQWIDLEKARVRAAVEAGADALWIDNTLSYYAEEDAAHLIDALYSEAARTNPHFVIVSNLHQRQYTWGRLQNGVTTEDGQEPGYYTDKQPPYVVTNAGLLRYNYAVGEGWRPVSVEDEGRHGGDRLTTPMAPRKWQLAIAECAMNHVGLEVYSEGLFLRDLYFADPRALEGWRVIGAYNAFLEKNEPYYTHPKSLARVAILSDATGFVVPYLNQLSKQDLNYDVIFNVQTPRPDHLKSYQVIVLPNTNPLSAEWCAALSRWVVDDGGTLISVQDASLFPPGPVSLDTDFGLGALLGFSYRNIPESTQVVARGRGSVVYLPQLLPPDEMSSLIRQNLKQPELVEVEPREATLSSVAYQPQEERIILHLLNYQQKLERELRVRVYAPVKKVEIFSPDSLGDTQAKIGVEGREAEITIPELDTYDLVAIYPTSRIDIEKGIQQNSDLRRATLDADRAHSRAFP
jgi:hypothetical protein